MHGEIKEESTLNLTNPNIIAHEKGYNDTYNLDIDKPIKIKTCELPLTLTVDDIAKALGVSKQNAYSLCHRKSFPCVQVGKRLVIPRAAFEKWLENPFIFESEDN